MFRSLPGVFMFLLLCASLTAQQPIPTDWIDPATGHRIIRLSSEDGMQSLYFHQNPYTAQGDKLFVTGRGGLYTVDLTKLGEGRPKVEKIANGFARSPIVGRKTRQVFYVGAGGIYSTHLDTHETRLVVAPPRGYGGASGLAINADETMLASTGSDARAREVAESGTAVDGAPVQVTDSNRALVLYTVEIATGKIRPVLYAKAWLNHTQFSPTDPGLLLFCHEGDWHNVDRVWTIRSDGSALRLMHRRTMQYEIAGHEFFSFDGNMVWYDLQTPRSAQFWLAGVDLKTGQRIRYPIERLHWSVHYNQ